MAAISKDFNINFTLLQYYNILCIKHNHTPRCSYEISAASLSWLEHFRVQCCT